MSESNLSEKFKDCDESKRSAFISALENSGIYKRRSYYPVDEKSHFERFNYSFNNDKISIVYDTKANILSITSRSEILDCLREVFNGKIITPQIRTQEEIKERDTTLPISAAPKSNNLKSRRDNSLKPNKTQPSSVSQNTDKEPSSLPPSDGKLKNELSVRNIRSEIAPHKKHNLLPSTDNSDKSINLELIWKPQKKAINSKISESNSIKNNRMQLDKVGANMPKNTQQNVAENNNLTKAESVENDSALEYKNGFAIKDYALERLNDVLAQLKNFHGLVVKAESIEFEGKPEEVRAYKVEDKLKQKLYLRFMPEKKSIQMQGKQSKLFAEVQNILYKGSDYKTAVNSYIKQSGEDTNSVGIEKKLKKLVPYAMEYLSEQSKKDITFALIDIYSDETKLSDYSGLLVSPYRGLERLIFDLQVAEDINVKMIGQGYEKRDDGSYCLKSGYRKKINSVVYNEVMSDLYTEYFEKRNYYLHSDNTVSSEARAIESIDELRKIFDNLLEIINYNCQKLSEIHFSIDPKPTAN